MKYLKTLKIELVKGEYKNPIKGQVKEPSQIYDVFKKIKDKAQETLIGVYLANDLQVNAYDVLSLGSSTETDVSPDEVFSRAVITRSPYIILIHNHPSGNAKPSPDDLKVMKSLQAGARALKKTLLDFIIVADESYWSMFEEMDGGEYALGPIE